MTNRELYELVRSSAYVVVVDDEIEDSVDEVASSLSPVRVMVVDAEAHVDLLSPTFPASTVLQQLRAAGLMRTDMYYVGYNRHVVYG